MLASDCYNVTSNKPTLLFSTRELAQSYINAKWAELHPEPIFVTEDGVKVFEGQEYWYVRTSGYYKTGQKGSPRKGQAYMSYEHYHYEELKNFSTRELAQLYLNRIWARTESEKLKAEADKLDAEYQSLLKSKS